jgi:hypothetical protein
MMWSTWWMACSDGPTQDSVTLVTSADTSSTPTLSTASTADSAHSAVDTGFPDDCDPAVQVPGPFGVPDETRPPDPHQDVLGSEPTPFGLHLSMPGSDPSTSVAFVWRTDVDTLATTVEYGEVGGGVSTLTGASFTYGGVAAADFRVHEVKVCRGLTPGTTWRYRVGGPGAYSPWYEFSTPRADADHLRVAFAGDSRGSYLQWSLLLEGLAQAEPDLLLFAGDLVNVGTNQLEWDFWFRAGEAVLPRKVLLPAHGNHEFLATNWFAQWSLPGNEQWYQVRQGPLHLVVLNDTAASAELDEQAAYVAAVLGLSDATWKVVMHHQSAYATCTRHGSNLTLRDKWVPAFEAAGVDLVIGGHNHVYERSVPLLADVETDAGSGITYLVTGGAGAPLYPTFAPEAFNAVAVAREHGTVADFGPTEARFLVRDQTGEVLDEFVLPAD